MFTTASKHFKFAVNSFQKPVLVIPNVTETFYYPRRVRHSKSGRQTRLHLVSNRNEDLTKPLHGDVFITF